MENLVCVLFLFFYTNPTFYRRSQIQSDFFEVGLKNYVLRYEMSPCKVTNTDKSCTVTMTHDTTDTKAGRRCFAEREKRQRGRLATTTGKGVKVASACQPACLTACREWTLARQPASATRIATRRRLGREGGREGSTRSSSCPQRLPGN